MKISIVISEPWDFVTEQGSGPFKASVIQIGIDPWNQGQKALLIYLDTPFIYKGVNYKYLIVTSRYDSDDVSSLVSNSSINCNFVGIPKEKATGPNAFDLSWWRGGLALIGNLRKLDAGDPC